MEHYLETCTSDPYVQAISHTCPVATTNLPGRPPYLIDGAQVEAMMELEYSYEEMAGMIGISTRTLRRHREQLGLPLGRAYSTISDNELDSEIASTLQVSVSQNQFSF